MPKSADWKRVDELFEAALDQPEEERLEWLSQQKDSNVATIEKVRALLQLSREESPVDKPLQIDSEDFDSSLLEGRAPQQIDSYEILELIGRGGMGVVYKSRRKDVGKIVALKVLDQVRASPERTDRFLRERELLSRLSHPNIAQLFDAGLTEDGLPYYAMELVEGEQILNYADSNGLSINERLILIQDICKAVEFAHRSLIVHRDIKPSNILISKDGNPKLLDFGIAKIMDRDSDQLFETKTGQRPMTLLFAAPEQILDGDITTATDVYGLGMVTYQLLAKQNPFASNKSSFLEIENAIVKDDPMRPSQFPGALDGLGADVDAIVMKAIRKEPEQRYQTMEEFRLDIDRYINNRPVEARRGSRAYRLGKFARRNKVALGTSLLILALISSFGMVYQRGLNQEKGKTLEASEKADTFIGMVQNLINLSDPTSVSREFSGESAEVFLDQGEVRIRDELSARPDLLPEVLGILAEAHQNSGNVSKAEALYVEEANLLNSDLPAARKRLISSLSNRAFLFLINDRYKESEDVYLSALNHANDEWSGDSVEKANIMDDLAAPLLLAGKANEAEEIANLALDMRLRLLGPNEADVGKSLDDLAYISRWTGKYEKAEGLYLRAINVREASLGRLHGDTDESRINLAKLYSQLERFDEAENLFSESLEIRKGKFDSSHPEVIDALTNLALVYENKSELDNASKIYREALSLTQQRFGDDHPKTAEQYNRLGMALYKNSEFPESEQFFEEARKISLEKFGGQHPDFALALLHGGIVKSAMKKYAEASTLLEESLEIFESNFEPNHPRIAQTLLEYARNEKSQNKFASALELYIRGSEIRSNYMGSDHAATAEFDFEAVKMRLALDQKLGQLEELNRIGKIYSDHYGDQHPRTRQVEELIAELSDEKRSVE